MSPFKHEGKQRKLLAPRSTVNVTQNMENEISAQGVHLLLRTFSCVWARYKSLIQYAVRPQLNFIPPSTWSCVISLNWFSRKVYFWYNGQKTKYWNRGTWRKPCTGRTVRAANSFWTNGSSMHTLFMCLKGDACGRCFSLSQMCALQFSKNRLFSCECTWTARSWPENVVFPLLCHGYVKRLFSFPYRKACTLLAARSTRLSLSSGLLSFWRTGLCLRMLFGLRCAMMSCLEKKRLKFLQALMPHLVELRYFCACYFCLKLGGIFPSLLLIVSSYPPFLFSPQVNSTHAAGHL